MEVKSVNHRVKVDKLCFFPILAIEPLEINRKLTRMKKENVQYHLKHSNQINYLLIVRQLNE